MEYPTFVHFNQRLDIVEGLLRRLLSLAEQQTCGVCAVEEVPVELPVDYPTPEDFPDSPPEEGADSPDSPLEPAEVKAFQAQIHAAVAVPVEKPKRGRKPKVPTVADIPAPVETPASKTAPEMVPNSCIPFPDFPAVPPLDVDLALVSAEEFAERFSKVALRVRDMPWVLSKMVEIAGTDDSFAVPAAHRLSLYVAVQREMEARNADVAKA